MQNSGISWDCDCLPIIEGKICIPKTIREQYKLAFSQVLDSELKAITATWVVRRWRCLFSGAGEDLTFFFILSVIIAITRKLYWPLKNLINCILSLSLKFYILTKHVTEKECSLIGFKLIVLSFNPFLLASFSLLYYSVAQKDLSTKLLPKIMPLYSSKNHGYFEKLVMMIQRAATY